MLKGLRVSILLSIITKIQVKGASFDPMEKLLVGIRPFFVVWGLKN